MISVKELSPEEWKSMAEAAHVSVFDETWDKNLERIDYALLMVVDEENLVSYVTVQQIDSKTCYLQYGGAFPKYRGTPLVFKSFIEMLNHVKKKHSVIKTYVECDNFKMHTLYNKAEFKISGMRHLNNGTTLVVRSFES